MGVHRKLMQKESYHTALPRRGAEKAWQGGALFFYLRSGCTSFQTCLFQQAPPNGVLMVY